MTCLKRVDGGKQVLPVLQVFYTAVITASYTVSNCPDTVKIDAFSFSFHKEGKFRKLSALSCLFNLSEMLKIKIKYLPNLLS